MGGNPGATKWQKTALSVSKTLFPRPKLLFSQKTPLFIQLSEFRIPSTSSQFNSPLLTSGSWLPNSHKLRINPKDSLPRLAFHPSSPTLTCSTFFHPLVH